MKNIIFIIILIIWNKTTFATVVSNAIEPVSYFINCKSELNDLNYRLSFYKQVGIIGISGIGKTQFIRMYAHQNRNKYNLIWFFDCNLNLTTQFVELAKQINRSICKDKCNLIENNKDAEAETLRYLAPRDDWLLVFDNIKINENKNLGNIIEWEHNGHVVLCSQDSSNLPQPIILPYLSRDVSISLVNNISSNKDNKIIEELVDTFKGYPFLIVQGAMFLNNKKYLTVEEYKKLLDKSDDRIDTHITLILKELSSTTKDLLYKIIVINNQRFSKELLKKITTNNSNFIQDLNEMIRFGLITNVDFNTENQIFEMHDLIRDAILRVTSKEVIKRTINDIINSLNKSMPQGVVSRYSLFLEDYTLLSNIEELINRTEKYDINIYKILELKKYLLGFYLFSRDYENCQKIENWLLDKQKRKDFELWIITEQQKSVYSECIFLVGVYNLLGKSDHVNSLKYLEKARNIINKVTDYQEQKFTIFIQLAQAYIHNGEVNKAKENLALAEQISKNYPKADISMRLFFHVEAQIFLVQGKYREALDATYKTIEANIKARLPENAFTAPTYLRQAEILNYMHQFKQAKKLATKIYNQEKINIKGDHETHASALIQMSRAELGLGHSKEALGYAQKAKNICINDQNRHNDNLALSTDDLLSKGLVAEANVLALLGKREEAVELYATAEAIYFNCYKKNIKYIDEISYLYLNAIKATCNLPDKFWYNYFYSQHIKYFGIEHPRSQEILTMSCSN